MLSKIILLVFAITVAHAGQSWGGRGWEGGLGAGRIGGGDRGGWGLDGGGRGGLELDGVGRGVWGNDVGGRGGLGNGGEGGWGGRRVDYYSPPQYEFDYGVRDGHTGDRKQQSEVRRGDVVQGEYSLREPDGTIRVVRYEADDKNGFNAKVIRRGPAYHPESYGRGLEGGRGGWEGGLEGGRGGLGIGRLDGGRGGLGIGRLDGGRGSNGIGRLDNRW